MNEASKARVSRALTWMFAAATLLVAALLQKRAETTPEMAREQKKRRTIYAVCDVVWTICTMFA